jgi:type IV pilus assembly protein PilA
MNRQKGFTLIEVMIVVAIIGILAGIAMASYIDYTRRAANGACLAETRGHLVNVMIAVTENRPVPVLITSSCERITLAGDQKSMTAYPVSPGNKGVFCDLDSSAVCVISDAVTP